MWRNTRHRASTGVVLGDGGGGPGQFKEVKSLLISSNGVKSLENQPWRPEKRKRGHRSSFCHTHKCWSARDGFGNEPTLLNKWENTISIFKNTHATSTLSFQKHCPHQGPCRCTSVGRVDSNPENAPRFAPFPKDDAPKMLLSTCDSQTTTSTSGCVRTLEPRRLFPKHHPIWGQAQLPAEEPSCV